MTHRETISKVQVLRHNCVQYGPRICKKFNGERGYCELLSSRIFALTAATKSSEFQDGRFERASSWMFSRLSLNSVTFFCTFSSPMTLRPYTSKIYRWMSATHMFLAIRKRITKCISHASGDSMILNILISQSKEHRLGTELQLMVRNCWPGTRECDGRLNCGSGANYKTIRGNSTYLKNVHRKWKLLIRIMK